MINLSCYSIEIVIYNDCILLTPTRRVNPSVSRFWRYRNYHRTPNTTLPTAINVQLLKTRKCQTWTIIGRLRSLWVLNQKRMMNLRRRYDFYNTQKKSEVKILENKKVIWVQSRLFLIIANAYRISCKFQVDPCHVTKCGRARPQLLQLSQWKGWEPQITSQFDEANFSRSEEYNLYRYLTINVTTGV